jgi:hypothetical protein
VFLHFEDMTTAVGADWAKERKEGVRHSKVPEWCQTCGINEAGNVSPKKYWQARVAEKALHSVVEAEKASINVMEQEKAIVKV